MENSNKNKKGILFMKRKLPACRLFLVRKDIGDVSSEPEGIFLKWIESGVRIDTLETTLEVGHAYEATVVVRNSGEGTAYIAYEGFIDGVLPHKWPLNPGRQFPNDPMGRGSFWIEVRRDNAPWWQRSRWRSKHFYAVTIPPAGDNDNFVLRVISPPAAL